jgi:hypothetical protein
MNQEYLHSEQMQRIADEQSVHNPHVRNSLILARQMGDVNERMHPPQRPAMLLTGYRTEEAAAQGAHSLMSPVYPPAPSGTAHSGVQGNQPSHMGQAQRRGNFAHAMPVPPPAPPAGRGQAGISGASLRRKNKRARVAMNETVIKARQATKECNRDCALLVKEAWRLDSGTQTPCCDSEKK